MRVVIITRRRYQPPWNEGIKNLTRRLHLYLQDQGMEVHVVGMPKVPADGRSLLGRARRIAGACLFVTHAVRRTRALVPDVVFTFSSLASYLGVKTRFLRQMVSAPLVVYVTGLGSPRAGYQLLMGVDQIMVGSPFLSRYFPQAPVVPPFAPSHFSAEARLDVRRHTPLRLLFLGAFQKERGVETLLQAVALVRSRADFRLTMAWNGLGRRRYQPVVQMIHKLDIADIVEIQETVDINRAYCQSDVVVIPRLSEMKMSFPLRIIEALSVRCPLIVSTACQMDRLIQGCGLGVPPGDASALADAIARMANDETFYQWCVTNCAERSRLYDSRISLAKVHAALKSVALPGGRA